MGKVTPELLAIYLDDRRSHRAPPVEDPVTAAELRALLDTAGAIAPPPLVEPDPALRSRGRDALLGEIAAEQERVGWSAFQGLWQVLGIRWTARPVLVPRWLPRPVLTASVVLALTLATGGGIVSAAQDSLPGDALYPVKTAVETVEVALVVSDEARAQVHLDLAARRLFEIEQASQRGRSDAARDAAEAFAQQVAQADQHLNRADTNGNDVSTLEAQLAEKLARQQAVLSRVQAQAPEAAQDALAHAAQAAEKGLTRASARVGAIPQQQSDDAASHAVANATPKGNPQRQPGAPNNEAAPSVQDGAAATSLAETIADIQALTTGTGDGALGPNINGLLAKLQAAQAALERGQNEVAVRNLNAFQAELNALEQSGRLSGEHYAELSERYREAVTSLGGTPQEKPTTTDERSGPDRTPGPPPNPGNSGNGPGHESGSPKGRP